MPHLVITHTYSLRNRGDQLLLRGTIDVFRKIFGQDSYFYIFSADPKEDVKYLSESDHIKFINQIPFPVYNIRNVRRLVSSTIVGIYELIVMKLFLSNDYRLKLIPTQHRETIRQIMNADVIIGRSIDQISDIFGHASFLRNLYVIWFVKALGKSLLLHSQTIYLNNNDGMVGRISRWLLVRSLNNTKVSVRENVSIDFLEKLNIATKFIPAPSYMIVKNFLNSYDKKTLRGNYFIIIPRIGSNLDEKVDKYVQLVNLIVRKYDADVVLMGQTDKSGYDDDYLLIKKIFTSLDSNMRSKVKIYNIGNMSLEDFCERLYSAKLIISERFISTMTGLSMDVPVITIDPYGGKNLGIMQMYDLQNLCLSGEFDVVAIQRLIDTILSSYEQLTEGLHVKNMEFFKACLEDTSNWVHERTTS
jgi:polysaccharide pyruvyl transferase WcaK-like protein